MNMVPALDQGKGVGGSLQPGEADLGILVSSVTLRRALAQQPMFECLPLYAEAAREAGLRVIFFSPEDVLGQGECVAAYDWDEGKGAFLKGLYRIPPVIHNRLLLDRREKADPLFPFRRPGVFLFNGVTRFDKWEVHQCLTADPLASPYLPITAPLQDEKQVKRWLQRFATLYLKPRSGSLGLGVIRLRQVGERIELTCTKQGGVQIKGLPLHQFEIIGRQLARRPYLVQEGIRLLHIGGRPMDIRVSVQRGANGEWNLSGMVARLGQKGAHVTNLAAGGQPLPLEKVLLPLFGRAGAQQIVDELQKAAIRIARPLTDLDPHIADLGLDLAVTRDGVVKCIEVNGRDLRITYRDSQELQMWRKTFQNPVFYAAYLLQNRRSDNAADRLWSDVEHVRGD